MSRIASGSLEARRKRQAELTSQRKAAAAALQAERAKTAAAEELKQRQADVEARKIAQEEAEAKLAAGGERWKEVRLSRCAAECTVECYVLTNWRVQSGQPCEINSQHRIND